MGALLDSRGSGEWGAAGPPGGLKGKALDGLQRRRTSERTSCCKRLQQVITEQRQGQSPSGGLEANPDQHRVRVFSLFSEFTNYYYNTHYRFN